MPRDPKKLTPKQEAFCHAYMETSNASEAYRRSYDVKPDAKPEGIHVDACKLLADPRVSLRVDQLRAEAAKRHAVTVDSVTTMLKSAYDKASGELKGASAAVSAAMGIAKLHGLITEKTDSTFRGTVTLDKVVDRPPPETREEWIARQRRELAATAVVASAVRPAN